MAGESKTPWQMTRLLMVLCWTFWILTFFITITVFQAVREIHVVAQVAQNVERDFRIFNEDLIQMTPLNTSSKEVIDEMFVRYYLEMRYSLIPDHEEMKRRWGPGGIISYLSTASVYNDFAPDSNFWDKVDGLNPRVVDILTVKRKGRYYEVDLDLYERNTSGAWIKQTKSLVVEFAHLARRASMNRFLTNPYGFIVTRIDDRKMLSK